jgi:hypothetical protein
LELEMGHRLVAHFSFNPEIPTKMNGPPRGGRPRA